MKAFILKIWPVGPRHRGAVAANAVKLLRGSSSRAHSLAANGGKLRSSFPTDQPAKRPLGRTSEAGASASAERRRLFCPFLIHAQWIKKIKVENLVENYAQ